MVTTLDTDSGDDDGVADDGDDDDVFDADDVGEDDDDDDNGAVRVHAAPIHGVGGLGGRVLMTTSRGMTRGVDGNSDDGTRDGCGNRLSTRRRC